jgi:hypothetical protein
LLEEKNQGRLKGAIAMLQQIAAALDHINGHDPCYFRHLYKVNKASSVEMHCCTLPISFLIRDLTGHSKHITSLFVIGVVERGRQYVATLKFGTCVECITGILVCVPRKTANTLSFNTNIAVGCQLHALVTSSCVTTAVVPGEWQRSKGSSYAENRTTNF